MGLKERRIINKIYYLKFVLTIGYSMGSKSKKTSFSPTTKAVAQRGKNQKGKRSRYNK